MKIKESEFSEAPRNKPEIYPGVIPDESYLYIEDSFYPLVLCRGRRIGKGRVSWNKESPLPEMSLKNISVLDNCLLKMNAYSVDRRFPVLAYGSNSNPAQIQKKMEGRGGGSVVPVVRVNSKGLDVVYSSHMVSYGAVPATLIRADSEVSMFVTFLDANQLEVMDNTEKNYTRIGVSGEEFQLVMETGEMLEEYYVYVSKHGALSFEGSPIRLTDVPAKMSNMKEMKEEEVLNLIVEMLNREGKKEKSYQNYKELISEVRQNNCVSERITEQIKNYLGVYDGGELLDKSREIKVYRQISSGWIEERNPESYTVLPNYDRKPGEYSISLHSEEKRRLQIKDIAAVEYQIGDNNFSVLSNLSKNGKVDKDRVVQMDQTIRNALGVAIRERVTLHPVHGYHGNLKKFLDLLLPSKNLIMRVQVAHIIIIEKPGCLVSDIAMQILGIEDGDVVVLESAIKTKGKEQYYYRSIRLRAYPSPPDAYTLRESIQKGGLESRFPNCSESLAVYPDLPWIFIDADARIELGLSPCSPVRVRASRRYQVVKEFREFSFLIIVTLLSTISLLDVDHVVNIYGVDISVSFIIVMLAVSISAFLVFWALKRRIMPLKKKDR